jgi:dipeptidyl aminopeptidase/acylaminoacyl peptidase
MLRPTICVLGMLLALTGTAQAAQGRPFTPMDLVMLDRASEPQLSPDGRSLAFTLRQTEFEANRGVQSVWRLELGHAEAIPVRLTANASNAWSPRWSPDGRTLYFLSDRAGGTQIWALANGMGEAWQVTRLPIDVGSFVIAPDGRHIALSVDVFTDCADLACTKKRLDERAATKASGVLYDKLFVRHWDTWSDGRRSQLFLVDLDAHDAAAGEPRLLSRGIDGDVPSKPFGDDTEYAFAPDGRTVYFNARIAGTTEPWSTNFDVYAVATEGDAAPRNLTAGNLAWDGYPRPSPDGRKLYYLAMAKPMHEADRFAIMELDLASGTRREVDPDWDRSPGALTISDNGRTLFATADDEGTHPLFAVDVATGKVRKVAPGGNITGFSVAGDAIVVARATLRSPVDFYRVAAGREQRLTDLNAARLKDVVMGEVEPFHFKGWNDEQVRGYVVKPYGFEAGKRYPVAFMIHGGPEGSWLDEFHYRWNPQTYAGAGYAVVAIDFHGSTGYGQAFTEAILGHAGDRPLEDLEKGWSAALGKFPFLDGDRACALGASYGGYMVNWIAGNWQAPWKCLVTHDGVFDSRSMYYTTEEIWFDEVEHGAPQYEQPEAYEKFNPVNHVADWKVPMLVVQGQLDYRIPLSQGLAVFTALQRRGVPSEFLYFPNENHWVLKPHNSLQWHETVDAWLKRWTGP